MKFKLAGLLVLVLLSVSCRSIQDNPKRDENLPLASSQDRFDSVAEAKKHRCPSGQILARPDGMQNDEKDRRIRYVPIEQVCPWFPSEKSEKVGNQWVNRSCDYQYNRVQQVE